MYDLKHYPLNEDTIRMMDKYCGWGTGVEDLVTNLGYRRTRKEIWLRNHHIGFEEVTAMLSDGTLLQYKMHIASGLDCFDDVVREFGYFFEEQGIGAKVAPGNVVATPSMGGQYGKIFTVYPSSVEQMHTVVEFAKRVSREKGLVGLPPEEFEKTDAYLQYELAVPGTGDLVYYTVDYADHRPLFSDMWGESRLDFIKRSIEEQAGPLDEYFIE